MIAAFFAIFILLSSGEESLKDSNSYYVEPEQHLERVAEAPYEFLEEPEPDLDPEADLLKMIFPKSGSSETASAAPEKHAKRSATTDVKFKDGRIFSKSSEKRLSKEGIKKALNKFPQYSTEQLIIRAENEIYAAAGYNFEDEPALYDFYMEYEWYQNLRKTDFDYIHLTATEQANIDLLEEFI